MTEHKLSKEVLLKDMLQCAQAPDMSVYEHGLQVHQKYLELQKVIKNCAYNTTPSDWRLPEWAFDDCLVQDLPADSVMKEYQVWHDCGKPYCLVVDAEGRRHFPNHAKVSEEVWLKVGGNPLAAKLMGMDMDAHLLKNENVEEFSRRREANALLLTALAEIHANADMFGGIESTSFKIKYKHLKRKGNAVLIHIKNRRKEIENA